MNRDRAKRGTVGFQLLHRQSQEPRERAAHSPTHYGTPTARCTLALRERRPPTRRTVGRRGRTAGVAHRVALDALKDPLRHLALETRAAQLLLFGRIGNESGLDEHRRYV